MWKGGSAACSAVGRAGVTVGWGVRGEGKGVCWLLGEGVWEGGVLRHGGLRLVEWITEAWQHGEFSVELAVAWHQHGWQHCRNRGEICQT